MWRHCFLRSRPTPVVVCSVRGDRGLPPLQARQRLRRVQAGESKHLSFKQNAHLVRARGSQRQLHRVLGLRAQLHSHALSNLLRKPLRAWPPATPLRGLLGWTPRRAVSLCPRPHALLLCAVQRWWSMRTPATSERRPRVSLRRPLPSHMRRRYSCAECVGTGRCPHGRERVQCQDCGGTRICRHGRQKSFCRVCYSSGLRRGTRLCEHLRVRKECGACCRVTCGHGVKRFECGRCKRSYACRHGRRVSRCKHCGGWELCAHDRVPSHCSQCKLSTAAAATTASSRAPTASAPSPD